MVRPRKYEEDRINTSIRLSKKQKELIYKTFDSIQAFIEASYNKLENRKKPKKKVR